MEGQNCGITGVTFPTTACTDSSGFTWFNEYDIFHYLVTLRAAKNKWPHLNLPKHTAIHPVLNMAKMKGNDFRHKSQFTNINLYKTETMPSK
jgi:hypothetical protein